MNALKAALWCVLALAAVVNAFTGLAFDGAQQVVLSVGTGTAVIASAVVLFLMRERRRP
ncbi:hypothetical protein [Streptomyces noursei]|uniref:hypothetical protein n=1 Tax=Streptomyces noursei TaxID=1971 RepID=UPI001962F1A9|nr:hypothetical protein [Streptomyces noursei]QRX97526.1 hypothetical protein JNO44_23690 [Streptomyces noursei]